MRIDFNLAKTPFTSQWKTLDNNQNPGPYDDELTRLDLGPSYDRAEKNEFIRQLKEFEEEIKGDKYPELFFWLQSYPREMNALGVVAAHRGISVGEPAEVLIDPHPVGDVKERLLEAYEILKEEA